jgi:hypothetical protein
MNKTLYNQFIVLLTSRLLQTNNFEDPNYNSENKLYETMTSWSLRD